MFYFLYQWIASHGWLSLQPEEMVLLRAALAIGCGFFTVILSGNRIIRWLLKQKVGDRPEFHNATLNELTKHKGNTPTMGGIIIIGAILVSILLLANLRNFYVGMAIVCMIWLGGLGAVDDWLKLTTARRTPGSRDGLMAWEKLVFQVGLGVLLAIFIYHFPTKVQDQLEGGPTTQAVYTGHLLNWPFLPATIILPAWIFWILTVVVITGSSNAVNLTDGMDGLAAGCMTIVSFAFLALAYVTGDYRWSNLLHFNFVKDTGELAIVCGAMTGACLGFLWYNCNPAQVFMGDTGSLALGGVIGYIAIVIRQEPMLLLVGGIFVLEASSVMMQVTYFRFTGGKRIFLCSPIHHHFHLKGWSEQQVVVRFWLISALCAAFGLATVKLR
ncbi:MAG TPA: phospho-N-acetylmuramoyl-pentapeptide-transferase [Phycisphaerae bacterium]|nr:phospho-N-acetylmuramoyl-pentapeptide-transferase [Phycisphaerae bacterium]